MEESLEVQRVMDSINDGTLGPYEHFEDKERAQISRYSADLEVAKILQIIITR